MSFDYDVFISYARLDNEPPIEGDKGWVSSFHQALETILGQLLGRKTEIWRDPKLPGNEVFDDTILKRVSRSAALVCVVSPAYLRSEWCDRELRAFMAEVERQAALRLGSTDRLFKVSRPGAPLPDQPEPLQKLTGYDFLVVDAESDRERSLDPSLYPETKKEYFGRVEDLAQDLARLLNALESRTEAGGEAPALVAQGLAEPQGRSATVYLARTTPDLQSHRAAVRRELERKGHVVLPDGPQPQAASELAAEVKAALSAADLSIHLVGPSYGPVPDGSAKSLVELQHDLAVERPSIPRLVWLPPQLKMRDSRQAAFIERLRTDPASQEGAERLEAPLEELMEVASAKLQPQRNSDPPAEIRSRAQLRGTPSNPFPGLRPFRATEHHLFFGRERTTTQLLRRLHKHRFLAVVGSSGTGKSSLVRAGLVPALHRGYMAEAGSSWRVALLRPEDDPIGNLATALAAPGVLGDNASVDDAATAAFEREVLEAALHRSSLGLADATRRARLAAGTSLLVVVDQFEEIFRFRKHDDRDDAAAFVALLLAAASQHQVPVYVVVTMRTDYLGESVELSGLPAAINKGQFLVPRLDRREVQDAIESPVKVAGSTIAPRLVQRLLNDLGSGQDRLPVLQHALMRLWDCWQEDHADGEPLDLRHYEAVGTLAMALDNHAEEAYAELPDEPARQLTATLFPEFDSRRLQRG